MTPEHQQDKIYRRQRIVFTAMGVGIAGSLVFWPLLTSFTSIFLFVYWAVFATKDFSFRTNRLYLVLLFTSLYLLVIAGSFYSENTDAALFKLTQKTPLALFPLVFGTSVALTGKVCSNILLSFVWFTVAGCLFCFGNGVMGYIQTGETNMLHGYEMVVLKDMSPFMLGLFCLLSIMYLLQGLYLGRFKPGKEKSLYLGILIMLSAFLFILGNRNVLFSWSVVITFFFLRNVAGRNVRFAFFGVLLAVFTFTAVFNPSFRRQVKDLTSTNSIELDADKSLGRGWGGKAIRVAIWSCSMDIIREEWKSGVGTGDVQDALQTSYEKRKFYFASRYNLYNAHNQFIQETVAYGITGFLLFTTCLLLPLMIYSRGPGKQLYWLFILSFLIICLTESVLEISKGIVFYSFFNSIFAFIPMKNSSHLQTKEQH